MSDPWPPRPPDPAPADPRRPSAAEPAAAHETTPPAGPENDRRLVNRRAFWIAVIVVLALVALAALVGGTNPPGGATFPPAGATTGTAGGAAAVTRGEVARALAAQGLQVEDVTRPFRPAEAPAFATAPRILLRAILPDDPDHGLVVVYEFSGPTVATAAAQGQAAYIASGVGRVQFPNDARFVIRVVGSTVVFFSWSPAGSPDPRTAAIATALGTLGLGVTVPG